MYFLALLYYTFLLLFRWDLIDTHFVDSLLLLARYYFSKTFYSVRNLSTLFLPLSLLQYYIKKLVSLVNYILSSKLPSKIIFKYFLMRNFLWSLSLETTFILPLLITYCSFSSLILSSVVIIGFYIVSKLSSVFM